jgi:hypothetical protein
MDDPIKIYKKVNFSDAHNPIKKAATKTLRRLCFFPGKSRKSPITMKGVKIKSLDCVKYWLTIKVPVTLVAAIEFLNRKVESKIFGIMANRMITKVRHGNRSRTRFEIGQLNFV